MQLNSLLSLARETEREETKDRGTPTLFPGLQNSTHSAYSFHATVTMNQDKMPLKVVTTKNVMSKWDKKKIEKIIRHCSWSVDVTALLTRTEKKKREKQVEQESAGRMLQ